MTPPSSPHTGLSPSAARDPGGRTLRLAAGMFVLYGIATVLNSVVFAAEANPVNVGDALRMVIPPLGAGLVTWGLLHRTRWAWWTGLGFALSVLTLGVPVISVFEHGDIYWLPPSTYQLFFAGGLLSAGAAVALLLTPNGRAGVYTALAPRHAGLPLRDDQGRTFAGARTVRSPMNAHW